MKNGRYTGKELGKSYIKYAWFKDDQYHREDDPAVELHNGTKEWLINGKHHRLDEPAIEWVHGEKWWCYHGGRIKCQSQTEFERVIKLLAFK